MDSSFVYLYLRQNRAGVFLMVLIYLAFRNIMEQPDSAIIRSREPPLEISRSVDYRCSFSLLEVKLSKTMFHFKLHPLGCVSALEENNIAPEAVGHVVATMLT